MRLILTDGKALRVYERTDTQLVTVAEMLIDGPEQALSPADVEWLRTQDYPPLTK